MRYKDMLEHNALQARLESEASAKIAAAHRQIEPPVWQITLASGTRATIGGTLDDRLQITCAGNNPWAKEYGFLTLGMLSVDDQRELLEVRCVIEAWRAGKLDELPVFKDFARWTCPPRFWVTLGEGTL